MATSFEEVPNSREVGYNPPKVVTKWLSEGVFSSDTVATLARTSTPQTAAHPDGLLYRQDMDIREVGHKLYHITVPYGANKQEQGEYRFEFDAMGGTTQIYAGVFRARYPAGASENHGGLINVVDGKPQGCQIVIPAMKVICHFKHPPGVISPVHIRDLSRLVGTVDTAGFFDWDAYETLFMGATGQEGTHVQQEIAYHFAMSDNITDLQLGDITGISKRGHEVAWIGWKSAEVESRLGSSPDFVEVVQAYQKHASLKATLGFG